MCCNTNVLRCNTSVAKVYNSIRLEVSRLEHGSTSRPFLVRADRVVDGKGVVVRNAEDVRNSEVFETTEHMLDGGFRCRFLYFVTWNLIQRIGMHDLHEHVVISIIDGHPNEHRTLRGEGFL